MGHLLKGKYKGIVFEFMKPKKQEQKTAILCSGLPSTPYDKQTISFFSKAGFNVISMRYRGTWESEGLFLEKQPDSDIKDIIELAKKGYFKELYNKKIIRFKTKKILLVGGSFGGYASLLTAQKRAVDVLAFAPPIKINIKSMKNHLRFIKEGFGPCYRFSKNPVELKKLEPEKLLKRKILIVHGKKDKIVLLSKNRRFYARLKKGKTKILLLNEGHSTSDLIEAGKNEIYEFIKN